MHPEEWIKRCIDQIQLRTGMTYDEAKPVAQSLLESNFDDGIYTPEECADTEIEEWPANSDL